MIFLEIGKIQKLYKKYEQIISDIQYDSEQDKIFILNKGNVILNYVMKIYFNFAYF
jgi:hypothetical protein